MTAADQPDDSVPDDSVPSGPVPEESMQDEFDALPLWTAEAVAELGPEAAVPAGCRGSGTPEALRWLAAEMGLEDGTRLVDVGAGEGGPAELVARERGVRPTLAEPMPGACRAAAAMFGRPVAVADGGRLPFPDSSFDAAWCIGVLCTVADKAPVLRELRRVVGEGPVGLLVFLRTVQSLPDQPEGNHFPDESELLALLADAGLTITARSRLSDFPEPSPEWQAQVDRVDALIEERHGHDERYTTALAQQQAIGRLIGDGLVVGELFVARTTPTRHLFGGSDGVSPGQ